VASAEVVDRRADAQLAQRGQLGDRGLDVLHREALRDLDVERGRCTFDGAPHRADKGRLAQLQRRHVDRHARHGELLVAPELLVLYGAAPGPGTDLNDHAALFEQGDERGGRHQAMLRVLPAQQGLDRRHAPAIDLNLRLIVQDELVLREGLPQLAFQRELSRHPCRHLVGVEDVALTGGLRALQGRLGIREQRFRGRSVIRIQRDADAHGDAELGGRQHNRSRRARARARSAC
jgi:hypothetical protein